MCHWGVEFGDKSLEFPWVLHVHLCGVIYISSSMNVNSLWNWPNYVEQTLWANSNMQQDTWMTYVGLMWGIQIYFWTHIILGQRTTFLGIST
jgi:hypothetical protein